MKKKLTKPLVIVIAAVILIAVGFAALFISHSDKITASESHFITNVALLTHETEKGEKFEIPLSANAKKVGENLYLVNIILNDQTGEENYGVEHGKVKISLKDTVEIPMRFYSAGAGIYAAPSISYSDGGMQTLECSSDNGYLEIQLLLSGEEAESLSFEVGYAIIGKGLYSFNKFYGLGGSFAIADFIDSSDNA